MTLDCSALFSFLLRLPELESFPGIRIISLVSSMQVLQIDFLKRSVVGEKWPHCLWNSFRQRSISLPRSGLAIQPALTSRIQQK